MRYLFASAAPLLLARRWKGGFGWGFDVQAKAWTYPRCNGKAEQRQEQKPWVGFDVQAEAWTYPRCNGKGRAKAKAKARGRSSAARRMTIHCGVRRREG